jgi:hypothetical protein
MRYVRFGLAALVLTVATLSVGAAGGEQKVPLDKVPKPVVDAAKKRFPMAEIIAASTEKADGKQVYEISMKQKGLNIDLTLTPEGQIQDIEKEIATKDVPKSVADAIFAKYPKSTFKKAEELYKVANGKETMTAHEVVIVTADARTIEVVVSPDNKIAKEEEVGKK